MTSETKYAVVLIAPVGTREVTLTDLSLLPTDELRTRWNHQDPALRLGARMKGEVLLADLERYAPALQMEILGKAIRHVAQAHGAIDRLILVASDQPDPVLPRYRANDTIELARLVRALLKRAPSLEQVGNHVKIEVITDNPASYEVMRSFYQAKLPSWRNQLLPEGVCYLAVTGGTAQMSTMLLLEATRILRAQAVPLYVLAEYDMPLHLDVGRQLLLDDLRASIRRSLEIYAYHAAWQTLSDNRTLAQSTLPHYETLLALLDCARHRLNFNFSMAQAALFGADRTLPAVLKGEVLQLAHELSETGRSEEWLIAEVFYSASIRLNTEAYEAFVGRVFRFQEAMLRYLCERWGARFRQDDPSVLDETWIDAVSIRPMLDKMQVPISKRVTRRTLQIVALELAQRNNDADGEGWVKALARFEAIADLRNQTVITHGFQGVSLTVLRKLYKGGAEKILSDMEALLRAILERAGRDNPYHQINQLCTRLLEGR